MNSSSWISIGKMTVLLLADVEQFQETACRAACLKAIGINDFEKVSFLLEQAEHYVPDLPASFHGEMASEAYLEHRSIAKAIIKCCSEAQIAGAPSCLLEQFAADKDFHTLSALVEKGISGGSAAELFFYGGFAGADVPFTGRTKGHGGMDLAVPTGTPLRAALPGTVTVSTYNQGGYGYYVCIDHGGGLVTLYGHCSQLIARVGRTVQAGDVIALSGSTGRSTGPHLHFEVRVNGQRTNPRSYLP